MIEDDLYRSSTQYRLWSFTEESLASLRLSKNAQASARTREAFERHGAQQYDEGRDEEIPGESRKDMKLGEFLTVQEESVLVGYYCTRAMEFSDHMGLSTNVKATAVQYLKRFYLLESPMTYHPKDMMPSALFLATKTENHYTPLKHYVAEFQKMNPKMTAEKVIAPEFILTQGLRFTFDVRHPQRALEGGYMELMALAKGLYRDPSGSPAQSKKLQQELLHLQPLTDQKETAKSPSERIRIRIEVALHEKAKDILKTSAILTDVYFLYTPAQIWLSSFLMADKPLAEFYINAKFNSISGDKLGRSKLLMMLDSCATLMQSSILADPDESEMTELKRIGKKLHHCTNQETKDIVAMNKAQKREGEDGNGLEEKIIKKRKLERENGAKEAESVFGPAIVT